MLSNTWEDSVQSHQVWLFIGVNGSLLILGLIILTTVKNNYVVDKNIKRF
jgi:hypothetical protein